MADRINEHDGAESYPGMGAQFEDSQERHADLNPQHMDGYLHRASQTDGAERKKSNANTAVEKIESKIHGIGFDSIDRSKVGTHEVVVQEGLESVHPMQRWRQEEHTGPWNNIRKVGKLELQDSSVERARRGHGLGPSTAAVQGSVDAGPRR
jgi:hypothetical protein